MLDRPLVLLYSCLLQHPFQVCRCCAPALACSSAGACDCWHVACTISYHLRMNQHVCSLMLQIESWAAWGKVLKALDTADQ